MVELPRHPSHAEKYTRFDRQQGGREKNAVEARMYVFRLGQATQVGLEGKGPTITHIRWAGKISDSIKGVNKQCNNVNSDSAIVAKKDWTMCLFQHSYHTMICNGCIKNISLLFKIHHCKNNNKIRSHTKLLNFDKNRRDRKKARMF